MKDSPSKDNMFLGPELLKAKKKMYKSRYWIRRTIDNRWLFIRKTSKKTRNELIFDSLPDNFFDKKREKIVNSKNSAFVMLIMDKVYGQNHVDLSGWSNGVCDSKKCKKCKTKVIAIPKSNIVSPSYDKKYVFAHPNDFSMAIKCKIYDIVAPEYFSIEYINVAEFNDMSVEKKHKYIRNLLSKEIPEKVICEFLRISRVHLWKIKNKQYVIT